MMIYWYAANGTADLVMGVSQYAVMPIWNDGQGSNTTGACVSPSANYR